MAYKKSSFNPDALPMHVEPHQAAQMMSQNQQQSQPQHPQQTHTPPGGGNRPPPLPPKEGRTHSISPRPHPHDPRRPSAPVTSSSYSSSYSSPPPGQLGARPHAYSLSSVPQPARSPQPGQSAPIPQAGSDPGLFPLFRAVDTHGTGQLQEAELGKALRNGDYTSFDPETVRLMIKMFDHDRSGTIGFEEFCGLWGFLGAWRQLFDRFDEDNSGYISLDEFTKALVAFGYHLTPAFIQHMYGLYDRRGLGRMSFDLFVQSCISLKRITDVFKRYDTDRDGFITMSFEDFLSDTKSKIEGIVDEPMGEEWNVKSVFDVAMFQDMDRISGMDNEIA